MPEQIVKNENRIPSLLDNTLQQNLLWTPEWNQGFTLAQEPQRHGPVLCLPPSLPLDGDQNMRPKNATLT